MGKMIKPAKAVSKTRKIKKVKKVRTKISKIREAKDVGSSKAEKVFESWLIKNGILVEEQYKINYKFYDFKVKNKNILIEFHGNYFHCNPKLYPDGPINKMQENAIINDKYKKIIAGQAGFLLIEVWEYDFNNNKSLVKKNIKLILDNYDKSELLKENK